MEVRISDQDRECEMLQQKCAELTAAAEQADKRAAEQRELAEQRHAEELAQLKRTNQQLKVSTVLIHLHL